MSLMDHKRTWHCLVAMTALTPRADLRSKVRYDFRNCARNGFPDGRDRVPKTASNRLHVSAETALRRFQPAKARRFEAFVTASETLGAKWTVWWAREKCHDLAISITYSVKLL
jgi:hypothetical protein